MVKNAFQSPLNDSVAATVGQLGKIGLRQLAQQRTKLRDERRADTRLLREGYRDRESLLRPAQAMRPPLLERPVRAAPERQRLPERRRLAAEGATEPQR